MDGVGFFVQNKMPETATVSDKKLSIHIELHRNGVTVSSWIPKRGKDEDSPMGGEEISYVYKTINEMLEELPSFISVLKEKTGNNPRNPTKNEADLGNSKEDDY